MSYAYPQQQYVPQVNVGYPNFKPMQYLPTSWNSTSQVRPVTSLEEVKAYPIDFDGSVFYFTDVANKKIYTKFINMDGTVTINLYELKEITADQPTDSSYITRTEFESVIAQLKEMMETKPTPIFQENREVAAQPQTNYYQF